LYKIEDIKDICLALPCLAYSQLIFSMQSHKADHRLFSNNEIETRQFDFYFASLIYVLATFIFKLAVFNALKLGSF
jgi:hypothetical protein